MCYSILFVLTVFRYFQTLLKILMRALMYLPLFLLVSVGFSEFVVFYFVSGFHGLFAVSVGLA